LLAPLNKLLERTRMAMRELITAASGSGTTTLGRALSRELEVAFFDADDYFWVPTDPPYQQQRDPSARLSLLLADLAKVEQSVTAGSVIDWGVELEDSFSLIVFLTLQRDLRFARLCEREVARFGRADPEFLEWAAQYDDGSTDVNSRKGDERWLTKRSCPVLHVEGDISVPERVARVVKALSDCSSSGRDSALCASPRRSTSR
jgi:adenylate kinase family enzyme